MPDVLLADTVKPQRWFFRVTDPSVRRTMAKDYKTGRIPRAWITFGHCSGYGWGFIPPWCQLAVGRHYDPYRFRKSHEYEKHAPFLIIRLWSRIQVRQHFLRQNEQPVRARFYRAIVWRQGRGVSWTWVD